MKSRPKRSEVPIEQTWDMTPLFPTTTHWETEAAAALADLAQFDQYRGRLGTAGSVLLGCLKMQDALGERLLKLTRYASNCQSADGLDPANQAMAARAGNLNARANAALSFIQSEVLGMDDEAFAALFAGVPALDEYRHHLESLRATRAHAFSPDTESVLAALSQALDAPHTIYKGIHTDMKFPAVTDTDGEPVSMSVARYARLTGSPDREVRRRAHESFTEGLGAHKTALATSLGNHIQKAVTVAKLRGYSSALEAALASQQVPVAVYNNVLDTILTEAAPHVQRYMRLRQRVLGLDRVYRYDMTAPLDPTYDATMTWDEGTRLVKESLAVLGPEYAAMLDRAFAERWVDRADNEGKAHGAFNSGIYGWHPVIMMTWQDKARDAFTLVHELGHCGHRFLSSQNQNYTNSGLTNIGRFFLEAPSTANEALMGDYLLRQNLDVRRRRYIIEAFLGTFMHNMVTHLLEAELERQLFTMAEAGKPITVKVVMQTQGEVMERFFAGSVGHDEGARLTWAQVPHFYMGFYPLVYAAGLSAGCAVAERIREEGEPAVQRWLTTLKAGSTMHPLDLYQLAGIDMASPEPIRKGVALFGRLVADLEACYL